jgi:hypothetical protein
LTAFSASDKACSVAGANSAATSLARRRDRTGKLWAAGDAAHAIGAEGGHAKSFAWTLK